MEKGASLAAVTEDDGDDFVAMWWEMENGAAGPSRH